MKSVPVVFINCDRFPFLRKIADLEKVNETRTRNTLKALVGQRVFLAETGRRHRPLVLCSVVIGAPVVARSREEWERLRPSACIPAGSYYDWKPWTKQKYLYPLLDVQAVSPFTPPEGIRHGYVWMEVFM